jgi:hypothetical protein
MRLIILFAFVAGLCPGQDRRVEPVSVGRKQALIIGNSKYARAPLKNPANDAVTMEAALKKLGFEVTTLRDLDLRHMKSVIDEFTAGLSSGARLRVMVPGRVRGTIRSGSSAMRRADWRRCR